MRVVVRGQGSSCKEHFGPHNPKYGAKRKRERYELKIHAANSIGTINHHPQYNRFLSTFEHNIMLSLLMNLTKCCTVSSPKKDCKHSLIFTTLESLLHISCSCQIVDLALNLTKSHGSYDPLQSSKQERWGNKEKMKKRDIFNVEWVGIIYIHIRIEFCFFVIMH